MFFAWVFFILGVVIIGVTVANQNYEKEGCGWFHSWKKVTPIHRVCGTCGVAQIHNYDSQGGWWSNMSKEERKHKVAVFKKWH